MVHENCRLASTPNYWMVDCPEMTDVLEVAVTSCWLLVRRE
jgi:hypothetical protein